MTEETKTAMTLNSLSSVGTFKNRKRVGRGIGSGTGKTSGRGHKGQKSRSGGNIRQGFEGGQMPLQMRLPKFGFSSRVNNNFKEVNIKNINGMKVVNLETLKEKKLITKSVKKVKIFGNTEVDSKITVEGISLTKGAQLAIENAGGKVVDLEKKNNKDTKDKSNSEDND